MAMYNYDIKFFTSDDILNIQSTDYKSFKYETKKRIEESIYDAGKRDYCERRGGLWRVARPRQLKQLESKLRDRSIVLCEWLNDCLVVIIFSSGVIAYLTFKPETLDITQILFDRYCVGKLQSPITSAIFSKSHLLFTHADRFTTLITFGKTASNIPTRISDRDPHLQTIELGGNSRRSEWHTSWKDNGNGLRVLVYGATSVEPAPWTPQLQDHANLHLYTINGQNMSLSAYHQLENETLCAELSRTDDVVHIIEQVSSHKTGVTLSWLRYDVPTTERAVKLSSMRASETHVCLSAPARVVTRCECDSRLLAACIDGSLHIVHCNAGLTHTTRAGFIATTIRPCGELVLLAGEAGRLQCFDRALAALTSRRARSTCLDLAAYLKEPRRMNLLATREAKGGSMILVSFAGGPLAMMKIKHPKLMTAWQRSGQPARAVALLRAADWRAPSASLLCLARLTAADAAPSSGQLSESALGAYYAAPAPAPRALAAPAHRLARRYCQRLLRRGNIEKALSLAVDLSDWDLFCDARWAATRRGLTQLAEEAYTNANLYASTERSDSECSDSCSQCSSHSCSGSDDETSASCEHPRTKPPPLPRVDSPTILHVPIAPTENISTNSIRPNLHQYLDRDNTIWNTNVEEPLKPYWSTMDSVKPAYNVKWHSMDRLSSKTSNETKNTRSITDIIPREEERQQYKHIYQKELREDAPNTLYRYQNYHSTTTLNDRGSRNDHERPGRSGEKNKVKFSDTVTIAVMSEPSTESATARELADSLPLCGPHNYLAAFNPPRPPSENAAQKPPKIKVVHFGMV